jgi:hypothetical protein
VAPGVITGHNHEEWSLERATRPCSAGDEGSEALVEVANGGEGFTLHPAADVLQPFPDGTPLHPRREDKRVGRMGGLDPPCG